jgi:hypothetical protein
MSWRESFLIRFGPGVLSGITFADWLRTLHQNDWVIERPYWGRAAAITFSSISNSFFSWLERLIYQHRVEAATPEPPLFILGIWRSGTTLLHNLMSKDDRFAFPNFYQVMYPHTFLCTEKTNAQLLQWFMPRKRPQDDIKMGVGEPQEDEFALCCMTRLSFLLTLAFPRRAEHYDRYLSFREASEDEIAQWKAALLWFVKKLTFKYEKPLLLKSPGHTCRIRMLLDLFPEARFIHIHRHPLAVFQSTLHTARKVGPWWALQRNSFHDLTERTIRQFKEVYDVFFEEQGLIPNGHFHEMAFEDLEQDPLGQIRQAYEALDLPNFNHVEPKLRRYVDTLVGYKKNTFLNLPANLRQRIAQDLARCFDEWGYDAMIESGGGSVCPC